MKRILIIACVTLLMLDTYQADASSAKGNTYSYQNNKKEARKARKEERRAMREEYRNRTGGDTRTKERQAQITKENYKQRKKMDKATRKQNRKNNYGRNDLGNVFQVY